MKTTPEELRICDIVRHLAKIQRDTGGPDIDQLMEFAGDIDWPVIERAVDLLTGEFSTGLKHLCERHKEPGDERYVDAAPVREGELEVDDIVAVSRGEDAGAYVLCWVWVEDSDAGIERCSECGEILPEAGDGEDGLCATCADQKANETTNCKHCDLEVLQAKAINGEFCPPACADDHQHHLAELHRREGLQRGEDPQVRHDVPLHPGRRHQAYTPDEKAKYAWVQENRNRIIEDVRRVDFDLLEQIDDILAKWRSE